MEAAEQNSSQEGKRCQATGARSEGVRECESEEGGNIALQGVMV